MMGGLEMSARGGLNKTPNGVVICGLPWESEVRHTDGASCGFPEPTRRYGERLDRAAE
jgi:hypothetical protein